MFLRDLSHENRSRRLSSCVCGCLCFQVWRILQKYSEALSVALLIRPENVLQPEGNKEENDENTEKKLRVKEGGRL